MSSSGASISQLMGSTTKPSNNSGDLSGWKWQVLRKRRNFFLPLLNLLLIFAWLLILNLSNFSNTHFFQITKTLSIFFVATHTLILLALLTSTGAKFHLLTSAGVKFHLRDYEIQAKRLCYWCFMSTILVIIFLPALVKHQTSDDVSTITDLNMATIIFECASMVSFQHFGISPISSFIVFAASILSVIGMISTSQHNIFFACLIILGVYLVYASTTLQHMDYKHRYSQILEFEKSVSNKMMFTVQELASTLSRFDEVFTTIAPEIMFEKNSEKSNSDNSSWRWIKEAAELQVQRYHVLGFKHTISETSNEVDYSGETRFGFYKTCRTIFAMLETSAGFALPLFLDVDKHEVYITGQQDIFEITIFLLIYESVYLNRSGYCRISCENDSEVT